MSEVKIATVMVLQWCWRWRRGVVMVSTRGEGGGRMRRQGVRTNQRGRENKKVYDVLQLISVSYLDH